MNIGREIPLNPNIVAYHTDEVLTTAIVKAYRAPQDAPAPYADILNAGAESVHVTRYRIMARKPRDTDMLSFLGQAEPPLCEWAGLFAIPPAPDDKEKWCTFDIAYDPTLRGGREVYEASESAQENPIAARLFEIPGVTEMILLPKVVVVGKGRMFRWETMFADVERVVGRFDTAGSATHSTGN